MRIPDSWFIRELQNTIDKRYYVQYDPNADTLCWDIRANIEGKGDIILASFEHLNAKALAELRYRKWLGRKFGLNRKEREKWLDRDHVRAKEKDHENNLDMMVHGFMEMYNLSKKKSFS